MDGQSFCASALPGVRGSSAMLVMSRTRFRHGSFLWSLLLLCLRGVSGCGLGLPVRRFRFTTVILPATLRRLADSWNSARSTQQILHTVSHASALYLPVKGEP